MRHRGDNKVRTLVGAVGLAIAVLCGLLVPAGYFAFEYAGRADILTFKARLNAQRVAKYVYAHPKLWQYHGVRLAELIELPPSDEGPVRQRLSDTGANLVVDTGERLAWPILSRTAPIDVDGVRVGAVEAQVSLASFLANAGLITLMTLAISLAGYAAMRAYPLRVIESMLQELKAQYTRFDAALDNISQGLCIFDADNRLIACNRRYRAMYRLTPAQAKPGTPLLTLLQYRLARGTFPKDGPAPDQYVAGVVAALARTSAWARVTELSDGRFIAVENRSMPGGGWVATHEDITVLRRREEDLRAQNLRFDMAINNMSQGLCMFDAERRLLVCNERYAQIYGIPPELTRPGTALGEIIEHRRKTGVYADAEGDARSVLAVTEENAASARVFALADGRSIVVKSCPMPNGGWVATHEDVSEQRRIEARIAHMAHHDALTDLPNRVLLCNRLQDALGQSADSGPVAVLWLDLDRFKEVNDTLGHTVGDSLLKAVAERLRACVRSEDTVARLGGDEFAVVQTKTAQPVGATSLAVRIIEAIGAPYDIEGHQVIIGTSVGISIHPNDAAAPDQLLKNADLALYRAKSEGRGVYRFFEPGMDERMHARRQMELDLRKALSAEGFEFHFQPIFDLNNGAIRAFEALLRWNHPERGRIPPAEFIPLAEETGLIVPIGEWTLRAACREASRWPHHVNVAVNLSALQFNQPNLLKCVTEALADAGLAPHRLELEVTESVLLANTQKTLALLHQLRALGVRISMDDFGTGFSSLSNLRSFPFHKIKIDQSFIQGLGRDEQCFPIVQAVAALGAGLGMTTTAEGVETLDQLDFVRALGIDEVQGYFLGRPMPASEIANALAAASANMPAAA